MDLTTVDRAREVAGDLLRAAGVPEAPARRTAELLVLSDVWRVGSHGLLRLPYYLARISAGGVRPDAELTTERDLGALVAYDGHDGLGHWQLWAAAVEATRRALIHGVAVASVAASSHCGCLGLYTVPGLEHGLLSLVFTTGPAVMAAPGTATALLSTSPLAAGIPCRPRPAVVDLATSAVARGRIAAHAKRDEPLPVGWAVDACGAPTTDPFAALGGMLAPLGGGKGFALAFLVEALTAAAVGPHLATDVADMFDPAANTSPQRIAHLIVALNPAAIDLDGAGHDRMDQLAAAVTAAGGRVPGGRRPMPWEIDDDTPFTVADHVQDELAEWAGRLGV